jgi:hypothetical protein
MNSNLRFCRWLLGMAALLFAPGVQFALAGNAPPVSGSYQVLNHKDLGSESQIKMRIHLANHGSSDFSIDRMTLWDFSHAAKGGTSACAVALRAHSSSETTLRFTIRRSDYELWKSGVRPRIVLQMTGPGGTKSKVVVRMDRISSRISGQEAK